MTACKPLSGASRRRRSAKHEHTNDEKTGESTKQMSLRARCAYAVVGEIEDKEVAVLEEPDVDVDGLVLAAAALGGCLLRPQTRN
jgi:hypothetical protein